MFFAIDIDGVLAKNTHAYARYLNRVFGLGVSEQVLAVLENHVEFSLLPEVQAFLAQGEEYQQRYKAVVKQGQYEGEVQQHFVPVPGAREAVAVMVQYGSFCYVTCRKTETIEVTRQWLARHGFPASDQVYCCDQAFFQKYVYAYQLADQNEPIIMIDDRATDLVTSFAGLIKYQRLIAKAIVRRLSILAFGKTEPPPSPFKKEVFPVWALPTWDVFGELIGVKGEIITSVS